MALWIATHFSGDASPSCLSQQNGFMEQWRLTPFGPDATQAQRWLKCQPRSYLRLEAYSFVGLSGGHRIDPETGCCRTAPERLMSESILSPNPSIARTDGPPPGMKTWEIPWVLLDAQAACGFSRSASKRSSFFQSVKAMAAILRANVRRAISGFIPLSSKAT